MDTRALERRIDEYIVKEADSILGRPESVAGTVGQTALYMTPVLGSALSVADGVNDMFHGRWKSGLGNLALGVGTGLADFLSFGTAGTAIKGALQAGKLGARASAGIARAAKAGKGAGLIGRNLAAAKGFAKGTVGMGLNLANRGAKTMLGARGYAGVMNAGRSIANASRQSNAFLKGYKTWRPVSWAANTAVGRNAANYGRMALGKYRSLPGIVKFPLSMAAYSYIPGMDLVAQATPFGSMRGRMLQRAMFSDGGMMIPGSYQDAGRAANYEGPSLQDMAGMGRLYDMGNRYGAAYEQAGQYRR